MTKAKKKRRDIQWVTYLIDAIFLSIFVAACCLNQCEFAAKIVNSCSIPSYVSSLVTVLLPLVMTVLTITLSFDKKKIYGLTIKEYNAIRSPYCFTPLHISLITAFCIFFYALFGWLDNRFGILVLGGIAFLYSLLFFLQEMSIFSGNKWTMRFIFSHRYGNGGADDSLSSQGGEAFFKKALASVMVEEGIVTAYWTIKCKKVDPAALSSLLSVLNDFYWKALEDSPSKVDLSFEYQDIPLMSLIDMGYSNVKRLVSEDADFNYVSILGKDSYYQVTRLIYSLHRLCEKASMEDKEKKGIVNIIDSHIHSCIAKKKSRNATSVIIALSAYMIRDGETWFLEDIRDNNVFPESVFDFKGCSLGYFAAMMIAYALKLQTTSEEKKAALRSFISEPCKGLNSSGLSWKEIIKRSFDYYGVSSGVISSLAELLRQYHSVNEAEFYFWDSGKRECSVSSHSFDENALISEWLEMLFYAQHQDRDEKLLKETIDSLDPKDKETLYNVLSDQWLEDDHLKEELNTPFVDAFLDGDKTRFKSLGSLKEILPVLVEFKKAMTKNKVDEHAADSDNPREQDNKEIIESAAKAIEGTPFFDKDLSIENGEERCIQYLLKDFDRSSLLDMCLRDLPRAFSNLVSSSIKAAIKSELLSDFHLDDASAKKIIDLKPDLTSSPYLVSAYASDGGKYAEEMKNLDVKPIDDVLSLLFVKAKAIRFNAEINQEKTRIRELTGDELEELIRRDYPVSPSGLYRYSEYENDIQHSFFVSKDELKGYLEKQTRYLTIVFKSRVDIDVKRCLRFETKK